MNCDLEIENCDFEILKDLFEPIEMVLSKSRPSKMKRTKPASASVCSDHFDYKDSDFVFTCVGNDNDLKEIKSKLKIPLNLEIASTNEM